MAIDQRNVGQYRKNASLQAQEASAILIDQASRIKGTETKLFLAFDRDGTLVPYANRPEEAIVDDELRQLFIDLTNHKEIILAFVSARSIAQLQSDFRGATAVLAGNYGLEIAFPDGETVIQSAAAEAKEILETVRDELGELAKVQAIIEDHGYSVCVHWQTVKVDDRATVHSAILKLAGKHQQLRFHALPTSYEILPLIDWTKGDGLELIDQRIRATGSNVGFYAFFGDSAADEPGFAWVNGRNGISLKVASAGEFTCSKHQLSDTLDARFILSELNEFFRSR